jgi:predicted MPP superfamily phosphohydrolase
MQFAVFLSITLAIYGSVHFYVYYRMATMLGLPPGGTLWALRGFFIFAAVSFIASRLLLETGLNAFVRSFYWAAALWMGFFLYLLLACGAAQILGGALSLTGVAGPAQTGRWLAALSVAAALGVSVFAFYEACCLPKIVELEIPVKGGSPALDGFTIVQLSDVHLGVIVDGGRLERIVAIVNDLQPDLTVITGDLMDENADRLVALSDSLRRLQSPAGVWAITGNHEYYAGADKIIRHAAEIGIRFLQDEKTTLPNGLVLCGMNDPTAQRFGGPAVRLEDVLGETARTAPTVLFHHQPTVFARAAALGVDLMLSGHTHYGQIWPMAYISRRIYPHQHGLYVNGASRLYVSAGTGTWGPPMRLGARPEIVRIRLRTAPLAARRGYVLENEAVNQSGDQQ